MNRQNINLYKSLYGTGAAVVLFLLLLSVFRFIPAGAQIPTATDTKEQGLETRIQTFFGSLRQGNTAPAFEGLFQQGPLGAPSAASQASSLRSKVEEFRNQFGEIILWEEYDTQKIGTDIIVIRYILKYEQYPVIWTFTFYRKPSVPSSPTANPWGLVTVYVDPDLRNL